MKKIFNLLLIVVAFVSIGVNAAEISDYKTSRYGELSKLVFDDVRKISEKSGGEGGEAEIVDGVLKVTVLSAYHNNLNKVFSLDEYGTIKSVRGYYSVQGEGLFIVYFLGNNKKVYEALFDLKFAADNEDYKPDVFESPLKNIVNIAMADDPEFYVTTESIGTPWDAVYAKDELGNIYTDEGDCGENHNFCKLIDATAVPESTQKSTTTENPQTGVNTYVMLIAVAIIALTSTVFFRKKVFRRL